MKDCSEDLKALLTKELSLINEVFTATKIQIPSNYDGGDVKNVKTVNNEDLTK